MGSDTRRGVLRGKPVDKFPVDFRRGDMTGASTGSEIPRVGKSRHEGVKDLGGGRDRRQVVG